MLEAEFQYYIDSQNEIVRSYNGKVVVIKDNEVVDAYDNEVDAYFESVKNTNWVLFYFNSLRRETRFIPSNFLIST